MPVLLVLPCIRLIPGFLFSEETVWTTLKNNLSPQTSVTSAEQEGKAVLQITYNVTDEQVNSAALDPPAAPLLPSGWTPLVLLVLIVTAYIETQRMSVLH